MLKPKERKRFSISLSEDDYLSLKKIAEIQRPPMSLQYGCSLALTQFIESHRGKRLNLAVSGE